MYVKGRDDMTMFRASPEDCVGCAAGTLGFCARLDREVVDSIVDASRVLRYDGASQIGSDSLPADTALILRRGMIKVSHTLMDGREQIVDFLLPGDVLFGVPARETGAKVMVGAIGVEACEIEIEALLDCLFARPDLGRSFLAGALREIGRKNHQVMMLGRKRSDERVASFLMDLLDQAKLRGERGGFVSLPMSRAEIADYLSLTTETVSRVFSVLREAGIIRLTKPNQVVIWNPDALSKVAAGGGNLTVK